MKILSISDVITNSSSEVFCYITHDDRSVLEEIYNTLYDLFGYDQEDEITPVVYIENGKVTVNLPYSLIYCSAFFEAGLKALLEKKFKDCKIKFVD